MPNILWADTKRAVFPQNPFISAYRREKLKKLKPEGARRTSLCAELLLIEALRQNHVQLPLPLEIACTAYGKPYFPNSGLSFSLSHSSHYAACALSDVPIGLDIQILTGCEERLVRRFFTACEQEHVFSAKDRDAAFTALWCRKESYLKAIGQGLRVPLDSFDVSDANTVLVENAASYAFREYRVGDLFFCLCAPEEKVRSSDQPVLEEMTSWYR